MSFLGRSCFCLSLISSSAFISSVSAAADHRLSFSIPAQKLTSALMVFSQQSGLHVAFDGKVGDSLQSVPLHGKMDAFKALHKLLGQTGFVIDASNPNFITLRTEKDHKLKTANSHDTNLTVQGHRNQLHTKRSFAGVVDSTSYDDTSSLGGGASSVADLLVLLPGVAGIQDGDQPRYISVRGISPDLNQTTLDGITLATIGDNGGGTRRVNLQNIPGELTGEDNIYKTFTAEQDGGAIGAVIDMMPRSAFDYKGFYKYLDAYGVYSTYRGAVGANKVPGLSPHLAQGAKAVIADRFGENKEFGIIASFRYQKRIRNSYKKWQDSNYYYDDKGKPVGGESNNVPDRSQGWNGLTAPADIEDGNYSNAITNLGGSARAEWKPVNSGFTASLMGYSYERWENSLMDHTYLLMDNPQVWNQTATSGRELLYRSASYVRQDRWQTNSNGVLGDLGWHDAVSALKLRVGYTWEEYENYQPRLTAYAYPKKQGLAPIYGDYLYKDNFATLSNVSDLKSMMGMKYNLSQIQQYDDDAREGVTNVRLDYTRNLNSDSHGFGFATGFEWRTLNVTDQMNYRDYVAGGDATPYMFTPSFRPPGTFYTLPWINMTNFPWDKQKLDVATSNNDTLSSFYRYKEQLLDGYLSLHYKWQHSQLIAGVRADGVSFSAYTPQIESGTASGKISKNNGGYLNPLPSVTFMHEFPKNFILHAAWSESVGRPRPNDIAQAQKINCSDDAKNGAECTLSRGNPNLRPRRANNFDVSLDKYFDHGRGVFSVAYFDKMIKDDIYTLSDYQILDGVKTQVTEPLNANKSSLMGVEVSVIDRKIKGPWNWSFDVSANGTWMRGRMNYTASEGTYKLHQLPDQPNYIFNSAVTWHIPQVRGAIRATFSYTPKYLTDPAANPWQNSGYGELASLDLGAWHDITDNIRFKYEVYNLVGAHRTYRMGDRLQQISEKDYYGRSIYFEVVVN